MVIALDLPFSNDWRKGYLRKSKDGRKRVDLFNSDSDRTTISYARYLISCSLRRYLTSEEEVDHIDRDSSNDSLDNLQILSVEEHKRKTSKENTTGRASITLICPECKTEFLKETRFLKPDQSLCFCSRQCNGRYYTTLRSRLKKEFSGRI